MKIFSVQVSHWPSSTDHQSDLWLGYTGWGRGGSHSHVVGTFTVEAETRGIAITEAIRQAKAVETEGIKTCQNQK